MAGLARYLAPDERVILETRRHLSVLLRPFGLFVGAVFAASVVGFVVSPGSSRDLIDQAVGLVAAYFSFKLAWEIWCWWVDMIVVTDQRIFEVAGILTRSVSSMPLSKVTDMTYRRSLLGRILGYGDLVVETPGQKQAFAVISRLPRPDDFYRTVTALVTVKQAATPMREVFIDEQQTGPLPRISL